MGKNLRVILLIILILAPIIFYRYLNQREDKSENILPVINNHKQEKLSRPRVALIFDDMGESLQELKDVYALDIPLTVSIIPGLKFSKNVSHIASRCGFSVFIHLPLQPKEERSYKTAKFDFISSSKSRRKNQSLLRYYLNSLRQAIGVNNHMGSGATEDAELMDMVLDAVKARGLVFVDSRTSLESVAYDIAHSKGMVCGYNEGFVDSVDDPEVIRNKLEALMVKAQEKGNIIIIAHPRENTLKVLREKVPSLKSKVDFVTARDYFDL